MDSGECDVVVVGNSAAGLSALESLTPYRAATVTVVSGEGARPYSRVLLPYYLRGRIAHADLFIRPEGYYERLDARTVFGEVVERLDPYGALDLCSAAAAPPSMTAFSCPRREPFSPPVEGPEGPESRVLDA